MLAARPSQKPGESPPPGFWLVRPQFTAPRDRALEAIRIITTPTLLHHAGRKVTSHPEIAQLSLRRPPLSSAEALDILTNALGPTQALEYIVMLENRVFADWIRHSQRDGAPCRMEPYCQQVSVLQSEVPGVIVEARRLYAASNVAVAAQSLNSSGAGSGTAAAHGTQPHLPTPGQVALRAAQHGTGTAVAPASRVLAAPLGLSALPNLFGEASKRTVFGANHVYFSVLASAGAVPSAWHGATSAPVWAAQSAKGNRAAVALVEKQLRAYDEAAADRAAAERSVSASADIVALPTLQRDLVALQRDAYAAAETELLACRRIEDFFKRSGAVVASPAGSRGEPLVPRAHDAELQAFVEAASAAHANTGALRAKLVALGDRVKDVLRAVPTDWRDAGVCSSGGAGLGFRMRMILHSRRAILWPQDALAAPGFDPVTGRESTVVGAAAPPPAGHWLPSVGLRPADESALLTRLVSSAPAATAASTASAAPPVVASPAGVATTTAPSAAASSDPPSLELLYSPQPGAAWSPAGSAAAYLHDVASLQLLNVLAGVLAVARARQLRTLQGLRALKARATHWVVERTADAAAATATATVVPGRPLPPPVVLESRDPHTHAKWITTVDTWHAAFAAQRASLVQRAHSMALQTSSAAAAVAHGAGGASLRVAPLAIDSSGWPR